MKKKKIVYNKPEAVEKIQRIPRTFVFDHDIKEDDYHKFIDPDVFRQEDFEEMREDFTYYRREVCLNDK